MKKITLALMPLLSALLFFACSNEGFQAKTAGKIFCFVEAQNKCAETTSENMCIAVGGEIVSDCEPNANNSSSSVGNSSSSVQTYFGCWMGDVCNDWQVALMELCESMGGVIGDPCDPMPSSSSATGSSSSDIGGSSSSIASDIFCNTDDMCIPWNGFPEESCSELSGQIVVSCPGSSSSNSSSSVAASSSSISSSSSSPPAPETSGVFEFRNFDYSSSGSKIYFLGTNNMYASGTVAQSKLYNTLEITNAAQAGCGAITTEVTGLEGLTSMPTANPATSPVAVAGEIKAYAVATCNDKKDTLKTAMAEVVPNQTLSDCHLPSSYVYKSEPVKDLVTVNNNYGRCVNVTYNPAAYPATESTVPQIFSTRASCGSITQDCSGLNITAVANSRILIDHEGDPKNSIPGGNTVIEFNNEGYNQNGSMKPLKSMGCGESVSNTNTWTVKLNGTIYIENEYWKEVNIPSYATNGNRILQTNSEAVKCIYMFKTL